TDVDAAVGSLRRRIDNIDDPDLRYEMAVDMFGEASELDPRDPFLATFQQAYRDELGRPGEVIGMQFTTDARFVRNQAGIPAVASTSSTTGASGRLSSSSSTFPTSGSCAWSRCDGSSAASGPRRRPRNGGPHRAASTPAPQACWAPSPRWRWSSAT